MLTADSIPRTLLGDKIPCTVGFVNWFLFNNVPALLPCPLLPKLDRGTLRKKMSIHSVQGILLLSSYHYNYNNCSLGWCSGWVPLEH